MYWVRLWYDMPTDPKWRTIAKLTGQPVASVIAVFNMMMVSAVNTPDKTERGQLKNWRDDDVAAALDLETEQVQAIREAMEGRVVRDWRLTGWEARQPLREDSSTARVRHFRERNVVKRSVTQGNASEKETELEADTDTKKDILGLVTSSSLGASGLSPQPEVVAPQLKVVRGTGEAPQTVSVVLRPHEKAEFDKWFEAYIKPVRKVMAQAAYVRALKKVTDRVGDPAKAATLLLRAASVYTTINKSNDRQYEPGPDKWLDDERWDDDDLVKILATLSDNWKPGDHFSGAISWHKLGTK